VTISSSARVDASVRIGAGTRVWDFAVVRERVEIGSDCTIGVGAYLGPGVLLGDNCRIQNHAQIFEQAVLDNNCFVGPGCVFTNDRVPRAVNLDGTRRQLGNWEPSLINVREGASIGANVVCVGPLTIGSWALVGSGAVVLNDVPDHALVVGSPARFVGWVGKSGNRLERDGARWRCVETGDLFVEDGHGLRISA